MSHENSEDSDSFLDRLDVMESQIKNLTQHIEMLQKMDSMTSPSTSHSSQPQGNMSHDNSEDSSPTTLGLEDQSSSSSSQLVCGKDKKRRVQDMEGKVTRTGLHDSDSFRSRIDVMESQVKHLTQQIQMLKKMNLITQMSSSHSSQSKVVRRESSIPETQMEEARPPSPTPPRIRDRRMCYLKNFSMNKTYASGVLVQKMEYVPEYYLVCLEEIFDKSAELKGRDFPEGSTFADVEIGSLIKWPWLMIDII